VGASIVLEDVVAVEIVHRFRFSCRPGPIPRNFVGIDARAVTGASSIGGTPPWRERASS
jgi:hypothetical protein